MSNYIMYKERKSMTKLGTYLYQYYVVGEVNFDIKVVKNKIIKKEI